MLPFSVHTKPLSQPCALPSEDLTSADELPDVLLVNEILPRLDIRSISQLASSARRMRGLVNEAIEVHGGPDRSARLKDLQATGEGCRAHWLRRALVEGPLRRCSIPYRAHLSLAPLGAGLAFYQEGCGISLSTADGEKGTPFGPTTGVQALAWSCDGNSLWATREGCLDLFDPSTAVVRATRDVAVTAGVAATCRRGAVSPCGVYLATIGGEGQLTIEDLEQGRILLKAAPLAAPEERQELRWSPKGGFLVVESLRPTDALGHHTQALADIYASRDAFAWPRRLKSCTDLAWSQNDCFLGFRGVNFSYVIATDTFPVLAAGSLKIRLSEETRFNFSADTRFCVAEARKKGRAEIYDVSTWRPIGAGEIFPKGGVDAHILRGCFGESRGKAFPYLCTKTSEKWIEAAVFCPWPGGANLAAVAVGGQVELVDLTAGTVLRRLASTASNLSAQVHLRWGNNQRTLIIERGNRANGGQNEVVTFGS